MNVLPFVFALLMVMGIMTYAKLETFLVSNRLQSQYICYMKAISTEEFNHSQKKIYDEYKTPRGKNSNKSEKVNASSKINFYPLLHLNQEGKSPSYANTQRILLKRLIYQTYENQPLFQEMQKSSQDIIEYLLDKISSAAVQPENKNKIERLKNLSNIDLGNEKLQILFATILHGSQNSTAALMKCESNNKNTPPVISYPPLENFVEVESAQKPIRVYLASPQILLAIFDDMNLVEEIIAERARINREFKKNSKANLTEQFRQSFQPRLPADLDANYFNFDVTSTQPRNKWTSS